MRHLLATIRNRWLTRQCESPIERRFYLAARKRLRRYGRLIPQYRVRGYRLDFALHCKDGTKVDIECDGKAWHSSPEQIAYDEARAHHLALAGYETVRLSGQAIYRDVGACVERVVEVVKSPDRQETRR